MGSGYKPEPAEEPVNAAEIIAHGMLNGKFTGKGLPNYYNSDGTYNFINARAIINGDTNIVYEGYGGLTMGQFIAKYAENFYNILTKY